MNFENPVPREIRVKLSKSLALKLDKEGARLDLEMLSRFLADPFEKMGGNRKGASCDGAEGDHRTLRIVCHREGVQ